MSDPVENAINAEHGRQEAAWELMQLALRCEEAAGPDRELDMAIHARDGLEGIGYWVDAPAYTASLDAAMSLVSADFMWWFSCGRIRPTGKPPETNEAFAKVWKTSTAEHDLWRGDNCATPALALCAAALRALAAGAK